MIADHSTPATSWSNERFRALSRISTMNALLAPCVAWFVGGLYLDGWAHNHGKVDNTFFTPWHAVFYSGYLVVALVLALFVLVHVVRGEVWQRTLPPAYRTAIMAAPLFALGGVADLWWHTTFGFEAGIEPLLSPPHLVLAGSMFFMCIAVARTIPPAPTLRHQLPVLLSVLAGWAVITFMLQFNHPFGIVWPERNPLGQHSVLNGLPGIVIHAMLTSVVGVWMITRGMPRGGFSVIIVANALLIALMGDEYRFAWGALGVGVLSEFVDYVMQKRPMAQRILARAVTIGVSFPVFYMVVIAQTSVLFWGPSNQLSVVLATLVACVGVARILGINAKDTGTY